MLDKLYDFVRAYVSPVGIVSGVLLWFIGTLLVSSAIPLDEKIVSAPTAVAYSTAKSTFLKVSYKLTIDADIPARFANKISCGVLGEFPLNSAFTRINGPSTTFTFLYEVPTVLINSETCVVTGYIFIDPPFSINVHAVKLPMTNVIKAGEYEFLRDLALYGSTSKTSH